MSYSLCRYPLGDEKEACVPFAREGAAVLDDPVTVDVDVPNGKWVLALAPLQGWLRTQDWLAFGAGALGLGGLLAGLQALLLRRYASP